MKILAADISADRAELVLLKISINGQREPLFSKQYEPASFSGPYELTEQFLNDADAKSALIERFCLSIAAPVENNVSTLSRLNWVFDA
jgi:glucokinase